MRFTRFLTFTGVLGLIVLLDPIPSTAQYKGRGGDRSSRGGFEGGGDRSRFGPPGGGGPSGSFGGGDRSRFGPPGGGGPSGSFGGGDRSRFGPPGGSGPSGSFGGGDRSRFGPPGGGGDRDRSSRGGFEGGERSSRGSRGQMDPERSWDMLVKVSGGRDTIRFDHIPPDTKTMLRRFAEQRGTRPLPETGEWSKAQYMEFHAANQAISQQRAGVSSSGGGDQNLEKATEYARDRVRKQDRDGDGRISWEEADDRLKPNFEQIDLNHDRHIDVEEYKIYMLNRLGGGSSQMNRGPSGSSGDYSRYGRSERDQKKEEVKAVAIRYGTLPKEAPSFFTDLDTDKDAQIALYEWRNSSYEISEFLAMDLNNDGLVTFDEYTRYKRLEAERQKIIAKEEGIDSDTASPAPSRPGSGSRGYGPGSSSSSSRSGSSGGNNPFRSGGGRSGRQR